MDISNNDTGKQIEMIIGTNVSTIVRIDESIKFYIKYRKRSYSKCEWHSYLELSHDDIFQTCLKRFLSLPKPYLKCDFIPELYKPLQIDFYSSYLIPSKCLFQCKNKCLIKWKKLPISSATWEEKESVPKNLLSKYFLSLKNPISTYFLSNKIIFQDYQSINYCNENSSFSLDPLFKIWNNSSHCILTNWNYTDISLIILLFISQLYEHASKNCTLILSSLQFINSIWMPLLKKHKEFRSVFLLGNDKSRKRIKKYCLFQDGSFNYSYLKTDIIVTIPEIFTDKKLNMIAYNLLMLYYKDVINYKLNRKLEIFSDFRSSIIDTVDRNSLDRLYRKIYLIIEALEKNKININLALNLDNLIMELEDVK